MRACISIAIGACTCGVYVYAIACRCKRVVVCMCGTRCSFSSLFEHVGRCCFFISGFDLFGEHGVWNIEEELLDKEGCGARDRI